jgi:hypothetical protein
VIAFGSNRAASNHNAHRGRDGVERNTGAGSKRLKEYFVRAARAPSPAIAEPTLPGPVPRQFARYK